MVNCPECGDGDIKTKNVFLDGDYATITMECRDGGHTFDKEYSEVR